MIKADVIVANKKWKKYISNPKFYIDKKLKKFEKNLALFKKNNLKFCINLSNDLEIKKLNKKYRKKNKITDILSFPFYEKKELKKILKSRKQIYLGDIIINLNKILKQNKKNNFNYTFDKIWVHGFVHLFGYRHRLNKDFEEMQKIENKIVNLIN
ncbi:MAG: rRNA maturation RNase YbeY [Pelagibacteraceae bacterium]